MLVVCCLDDGAIGLEWLSTYALLLSDPFGMNRSYALVIEKLKLSLVDQPLTVGLLQLQVVASRDVVMLVGVDALEHVILLEAKFDQFLQDFRVDWDLRKSNKDASSDPWQTLGSVPTVFTDVSDSVPLLWIRIQDTLHHVACVI